MKSESKDERYQRWVRAVIITNKADWECESGWNFRSPSGSLHDLSAADLTLLDIIESDNLFLVK